MKQNGITQFAIRGILILTLGFLINIACDEDDSPTGIEEPKATISGTLNLPADAAGKPWYVMVDNDYNGNNGCVCNGTNACCTGTQVNYTVSDIPLGKYYLYASVFVASDGKQGPQPGDYLGIYGGTFPLNVPPQPNVEITSTGPYTFNIDLFVVTGPIKAGDWTATAGFGGFDFIIDSETGYITQITLIFSDWRCGGVLRSGSVTISRSPGWDISNRDFKFETDLNPSPAYTELLTIEGVFAESGVSASGKWKATIDGTLCSGTWQAVPKGN